MEPKSFSEKYFSALAIASYLAWGAVWYSSSNLFGNAPGQNPWADVLLFGFLIGWLWFLGDELDRLDANSIAVLVVLTVLTFWLLSMGVSGSTPILLILLLSLYAVRLSFRATIISLLTLNAAYFLIMILNWQATLSSALVSLAAYGSFQMFALMVMRYGQKSERMADELRLVNADLMATRTLLADSARDQERLRLSRELHDVAGHKLTALKMNLRAIRANASTQDADALATADELAGELLNDLRAVVRQLRQGDGLSLAQGIKQMAAPLRGLELHLDMSNEVKVERVIDAEVLLRVAQEGLTNAVRHGRASEAWMVLTRANGHWQMQLDDNGQVDWPLHPGMGMKGMQERLESLDGSLQFSSSDHGGLQLRAQLPAEVN